MRWNGLMGHSRVTSRFSAKKGLWDFLEMWQIQLWSELKSKRKLTKSDLIELKLCLNTCAILDLSHFEKKPKLYNQQFCLDSTCQHRQFALNSTRLVSLIFFRSSSYDYFATFFLIPFLLSPSREELALKIGLTEARIQVIITHIGRLT